MQDTKLSKQEALHEMSMEENWRKMTDEEVIDALLSTQLSTYKQELIEWAEKNAFEVTDHGIVYKDVDLDELINYIKESHD